MTDTAYGYGNDNDGTYDPGYYGSRYANQGAYGGNFGNFNSGAYNPRYRGNYNSGAYNPGYFGNTNYGAGHPGYYGYGYDARNLGGYGNYGQNPGYWGNYGYNPGYWGGGYYGNSGYGPGYWAGYYDTNGPSYGPGYNYGFGGPYTGVGPQGYQRSDQRIQDDLYDRLAMHPYLDAASVNVGVDDGVVTLTGTVDSRWAKRTVEDIAWSVFGVTDVNDQLRVRGRQPAAQGQGQGQTGRARQRQTAAATS